LGDFLGYNRPQHLSQFIFCAISLQSRAVMSLQIDKLTKKCGKKSVLHNVSWHLPIAATTVLLGPSGSGKSTLLRLIAGFETPDAGQICWQNQTWAASVLPRQRELSYAPQQLALTPHWSVREHLAYPLQFAQRPVATDWIDTILDLVELRPLADRLARTLSGGEQRRLGLARALVRQSPLILLDEPLSELDRPLQQRLWQRLKNWFAEQHATVLWVTHDWQEAEQLADQVGVLIAGQLLQAGKFAELRAQPVNSEIATWLGTR
jgi:ABC-type Fe3+/spermidine/putrescine transport system ATPase subunit